MPQPLTVYISPEAKLDLDEATVWYERRAPGQGAAFKAVLREIVERIGQHPRMYVEVAGGARRASLRTFPYAVYYRVESTGIEVLAIVHESRDPGSLEIHEEIGSWIVDAGPGVPMEPYHEEAVHRELEAAMKDGDPGQPLEVVVERILAEH